MISDDRLFAAVLSSKAEKPLCWHPATRGAFPGRCGFIRVVALAVKVLSRERVSRFWACHLA